MTTDRVAFRAHFERYPASIKGAFVLRAADGDPHQVAFRDARVAEMAGADPHPLGLDQLVLDVAPNLDLFVPFEFPATELPPGWYRLECDVLVDGTPETVRPGPRFAVAWPRATTRRGTVGIGKAVAVGGGKVRLGQLECVGDSVRLTYESPEPASLRLSADGHALAALEHEHDPETGQGRVTTYPVMRSQERLTVEIKGAAAAVEVRLP
jgi:hypothetical protein